MIHKIVVRLGLAVLAIVLLLLGGCAATGAAVTVAKHNIQTDPEYATSVLLDVQNAKWLAKPTNDVLALKCWDYIETFVRANAPGAVTPVGEVVGVLSAYQKARNVRRMVTETEISNQLRIECAPLVLDSIEVMGRLSIRLLL